MSARPPVVLWQLPACWGLPNASPFCLKLETWLRMVGIPYEARYLAGPPRSKSGKVPYIERPDGTLVNDSHVIMDLLRREHEVVLDDHLDERQRAISVMATRTLEDHFYWVGASERWATHWPTTRAGYFASAPAVVRVLVTPLIRRKVLQALRGQGFGRMIDTQILRRSDEDVDALAQLLGTQDFFFGQPSSFDATAYGFFANALRAPIDGITKAAVQKHANLVRFTDRMYERWWSDWTPPVG